MNQTREPLTQDKLKAILEYDPETGDFTWKIMTGSRTKVGGIAGTVYKNGYIGMSVDRHRLYAHRAAFLYMLGYIPAGQVDHTNGIRTDNRWDNLVAVSHRDNTRNRCLAKNSTSGVMGITWDRMGKFFTASIHVDGRRKHLYCGDMLSAIAARKRAEKEYGYHPNHGRVM